MEFLHNAQVYSSHLHCSPLKLSAPLCFPHPSKPRVYHTIPKALSKSNMVWLYTPSKFCFTQIFLAQQFFRPKLFLPHLSISQISQLSLILTKLFGPNFSDPKFFWTKIFLYSTKNVLRKIQGNYEIISKKFYVTWYIWLIKGNIVQLSLHLKLNTKYVYTHTQPPNFDNELKG